ncbi:MAG: serine/threonine protein kinase, partial [Gammaproteobacteria bacterium]|nr:serine/threonine protein kinase [Gammaproteobacteria bacterium]
MGVVYLAERADGQFEQRVALKLIKRGIDTDEIIERFLQERQILARLDHPNIARLLDGGVTETGQPYFAMEYIAGVPLTAYCDEHRLDVEARLRLFEHVGEAVQYAHRNLIVHRDLKPSNILVTEDGTVKLLDFGIARLMDDEAAPALTQTGMRVLSPAYAAPEQVAGEPVTTATDVYSLGVVLYELLTGHNPHAERPEGGRDVKRPSAAVTSTAARLDGSSETGTPQEIARSRATQPERLRRRLSGDLDTICLKALRPEPEQRYDSAAAFGEDLKRHLAGLPVEARAGAAGYRLRKFIRRNRMLVGATGLVILALGVGLAATLWQAQRARTQAARA